MSNRYQAAYDEAIRSGKSVSEAERAKCMVQRRHRLAPGKCETCDGKGTHSVYAPFHDASHFCRSGGLDHCGCSVCF